MQTIMLFNRCGPARTIVMAMMNNIFAALLLVVCMTSCANRTPRAGQQPVAQRWDTWDQQTEESIDKEFHRNAEYARLPAKELLCEGIDLEGTWSSPGGMFCTSITFSKAKDGSYFARFESGGCLADWTLMREAIQTGAVVTFNRPVKEYLPALYTHMYTIQYRGTLYLIASQRIRAFEETISKGDNRYEFLLLRKQP